MDYNQPWGWEDPTKKRLSNTLAPLGNGASESAPPVQYAPAGKPGAAEQIGGAVVKEGINTGLDKGIDAYKKAKAAQEAGRIGATGVAPLSGADMAADAMAGATDTVSVAGGLSDAAMAADAMGGATDMVAGASQAAEVASVAGEGASAAGAGAASFMGPLGAAAGGLMEGKYDKAAGAAAGAMVGSMFGPLGTFAGAKIGGMAGDSLGDLFGFEDGTTGAGVSTYDSSGARPDATFQKLPVGPNSRYSADGVQPTYNPSNEQLVYGYADGTTAAGGKGGVGTSNPVIKMAAGAAYPGLAKPQPVASTPATSGKGANPGTANPQSNRGLPSYSTNYFGDNAPITYSPGQRADGTGGNVAGGAGSMPTGGKGATGGGSVGSQPTMPTAPTPNIGQPGYTPAPTTHNVGINGVAYPMPDPVWDPVASGTIGGGN
jgi:hypothetical protein